MPRTIEEIMDQADELAARFERHEPKDIRDASTLREVRQAFLARAESERRVADAVATARADGQSWAAIGAMVGTSGEAARQRYGTVVRTSDGEVSAAANRPGGGDPQFQISGRHVTRLRKARDLNLKELRARAVSEGAALTAADLFQIEQRASTPVERSVAEALASVLGVSIDRLEAADSVDFDAIRTFLDSPEFMELVAGWAAEHAQEAESTRRAVEQKMLAAQFRADQVDTEHLMEIARAILGSLDR